MPWISKKDLKWLWDHSHYPTVFIPKSNKKGGIWSKKGYYVGSVGPSKTIVKAIHKARVSTGE